MVVVQRSPVGWWTVDGGLCSGLGRGETVAVSMNPGRGVDRNHPAVQLSAQWLAYGGSAALDAPRLAWPKLLIGPAPEARVRCAGLVA